MSVKSWRATSEFRIRVSMSAIGSVLIGVLPARLLHARNVAFERVLAEAYPAERELPDVGARAAAEAAAVAQPPREFWGLIERLLVKRFSCHVVSLLSTLGE